MTEQTQIDIPDAFAVPGALKQRAKALIGPALLAVAADGDIAESERRKLGQLMTTHPLFVRIGSTVATECVDRVMAEIASGGAERVIDRVADLHPDLRETALAIGLFVSASDGAVCDAEHEVLAKLAMRLHVTPDRYNAIADAITVLYRASA